jgi:N-acetylated-alpha-linked acidic dipeptidase
MTKFGDPGFQYHATAAKIAAAMMLRLANADVLPYDYVEYARTMRRYIAPLERSAADRKWNFPMTGLRSAIDRLEREAASFNAARDSVLGTSASTQQLQRVNASLLRVERALTRPEGLKTRPWFRNLIYAADEDNGYANMVFPSVNEAIRSGNEELARAELEDLVRRFEAAAQAVSDARSALRAR